MGFRDNGWSDSYSQRNSAAAWFCIISLCACDFYISLNFNIESKLITERHNQRELKNLKADYTGKRARLLYMSKNRDREKAYRIRLRVEISV